MRKHMNPAQLSATKTFHLAARCARQACHAINNTILSEFLAAPVFEALIRV
jgi:hypothetical protein